MANPNPNIWGAPETWIPAKIWQGVAGEGNPDIKACRAKSASFGGTNDEYIGTIERAVSSNVMDFAPIDNSIVTCGQNPKASNLGAIKLFTNKQDDTLNKVPDKIISYNKPINWIFSSIYSVYPYSTNTNTWGGRIDVNNAKMRISPNPEIGTKPNNYNPNMLITPIVYYQIRSLWGVIWVQEDNNTYGGGSWWTLEDWKNNHNDKRICQINFDLFGYTSYDGTNITVSRADNNMPDGSANGVSLLEPVEGITSYTTNIYNRVPQIMIANKLDSNYYNLDFTFYGFGWRSDWENATIKSYTRENTEHGWCLWQSIPYTAANYEKIMGMCACYGIPFSDSNTTTYPADFNDNRVCLPIINDEGVATGEYTRGVDNLTNPFAQLDSVRDTNYDPQKPVDPNQYSNVTGFNSLTSGATMTKRYVLDAANVEKLGDDLWTICGSLSSTDFEYFDGKLKDEFLTTNPIDSIISLQRYPFNIPSLGVKAPIKLGKTTVTAEGATTYFPFNSIVFAGKDIFPRFGNCFLDYEPYTSYEVYVPFCGTTKIRAADILGHTLNIQMQIDLSTGSCTAYIMADQLVIETLNGSCGVDQTVSGTQTATINANIYNGILNQQLAKKQMAFQAAGALMPSNWINPIGYAAKGEQTETAYKESTYAIEHVETPPHSIGSASPLLSWCQEFDARIIIYYPEGDVIDSTIPPSLNAAAIQAFGHVKGFGTVSPGTVSSFHGYTQGTIIADDIPCTESERNRIKQAFESGVFLPYP